MKISQKPIKKKKKEEEEEEEKTKKCGKFGFLKAMRREAENYVFSLALVKNNCPLAYQ